MTRIVEKYTCRKCRMVFRVKNRWSKVGERAYCPDCGLHFAHSEPSSGRPVRCYCVKEDLGEY